MFVMSKCCGVKTLLHIQLHPLCFFRKIVVGHRPLFSCALRERKPVEERLHEHLMPIFQENSVVCATGSLFCIKNMKFALDNEFFGVDACAFL